MKNSPLTLTIKAEEASALSPIFQKGVLVGVDTGCSVTALLCDQWEIPLDYVMDRISTLFLDGQPVDDIDSAIIRDGAVLALSSAMPGLVGAMMRRGGYYYPASRRHQLSGTGGNNRSKTGPIHPEAVQFSGEEVGRALGGYRFSARSG